MFHNIVLLISVSVCNKILQHLIELKSSPKAIKRDWHTHDARQHLVDYLHAIVVNKDVFIIIYCSFVVITTYPQDFEWL